MKIKFEHHQHMEGIHSMDTSEHHTGSVCTEKIRKMRTELKTTKSCGLNRTRKETGKNWPKYVKNNW